MRCCCLHALSLRQNTNFLLLAPFGVLEWRFCRSKLILYIKLIKVQIISSLTSQKQVLRLLPLENGLCLYKCCTTLLYISTCGEAKSWRRCDTFSNQRAPLMYIRGAQNCSIKIDYGWIISLYKLICATLLALTCVSKTQHVISQKCLIDFSIS